MPKKTSEPAPLLPMEDRMKAKRTELIAARNQASDQLAGLQNQIYVIDQLLDPPPAEESIETTEAPPNGVPIPEGTI